METDVEKKKTKPPKRDDDFEKNDREKKQHTKTLGVGVYLDDKNSCPKQKARDEEEEKSRRSPRNRRLYRRHFFLCVCVMMREYLVMMCFLIIYISFKLSDFCL